MDGVSVEEATAMECGSGSVESIRDRFASRQEKAKDRMVRNVVEGEGVDSARTLLNICQRSDEAVLRVAKTTL